MEKYMGFDPSSHLRKLSHRENIGTRDNPKWQTRVVDYLDVQWRVAWFRLDHPDGEIRSEYLAADGREMFHAWATWPGGGFAEAHKTISGGDNALEKAQTQAIGRALALLGYGTQFCGLELGGDETDVADLSDAPTTHQDGATRPQYPPARGEVDPAPKTPSAAPQSVEELFSKAARELAIPAKTVYDRLGKRSLAEIKAAAAEIGWDGVWAKVQG